MADNYSEYEPLNQKRWRAITYDWDVLTTYSPVNRKFYCLSDFEANWLLSNVQYLRWVSRQENCPCTYEELQQLASDMEYALMSCVDFDPNQMDYVYNQTVANEIADLTAKWDISNTPSDVNPDTPDDFFTGDGSDERLDAFCTAVSLYVYSYANNWVNIANATLGAIVVLGLLASTTIVGGIIASVVVGGAFLITQTALDAFEDSEALDDVICCMRDAMDGQAITQANFEASLDACGFTVGSNQAIIRDIIASDLDQLGNWVSFINSIGNSFKYAENNVSLCPCGDVETITVTFDSISNIDYTITVAYDPTLILSNPADLQSVENGNPIPSAKSGFGTAGGNPSYNYIITVELADVWDLTNVQFELWHTNPNPVTTVTRNLVLLDSMDNVIVNPFLTGSFAKNVWADSGLVASGNGVKKIQMRVFRNTVGNFSNSFAFIDNLVFTGTRL